MKTLRHIVVLNNQICITSLVSGKLFEFSSKKTYVNESLLITKDVVKASNHVKCLTITSCPRFLTFCGEKALNTEEQEDTIYSAMCFDML
ncbi:hypothetical protein CEXT_325391 [Caerostris extrusa]|uniref:Uncharacterized protein n=1 Tax=Caerostris extrusa TaxID=172846 RepID=A0AAV4XW92_CAEEX|nr:hypothetical protein CEXT_325391 [Caerostris extrusa]